MVLAAEIFRNQNSREGFTAPRLSYFIQMDEMKALALLVIMSQKKKKSGILERYEHDIAMSLQHTENNCGLSHP